MADDAEKRFERAMDRLFSSKATSSLPAPAASSAEPVSLTRQEQQVGSARHELAHGSRGMSVSRVRGHPSRVTGSPNFPTLSTFSSSKPVCRPWDRGDLFRRLSTFKSMTWFGKPQVVGPVSCARKGWVNIHVDLIACEACNAQLSFPIPPLWSQQQAESAAESLSEKLDSGHKSFCPWKGNMCAETLAQFPPMPMQALVEGFKDRCDALLQLSALPVISSSAINQVKISKGPQIDHLLAQATSNVTIGSIGMHEGGAEGSAEGSALAKESSYFQSQKLISLCGWEPRFLPYIVDYEDDSTQSAKSSLKVGQSSSPSHKYSDPGPSILFHSKTGKLEKEREIKVMNSDMKYDPGSAVLDCSLCGASVGLWSYATVGRPVGLMGSVVTEIEGTLKNEAEAPACGVSAASGIDLTNSVKFKNKQKVGQPDEWGEAITSIPQKPVVKEGVLDLNLTIAGGPPPTQLISRGLIPLPFPSISSSQPGISRLENSEIGDGVVPNESQRSQNGKAAAGQVYSTTEHQTSKEFHADNAGYTNVDLGKDEFDDNQVGKGKDGIEDTSKCELEGGHSQNIAVGKQDSGIREGNGMGMRKRKRIEPHGHGASEDRHVVKHYFRDIPRYSSVDAMDTCYHSRQENSMESVEMPCDMDCQGTAGSGEDIDRTVQAQQSTCGQTSSRMFEEPIDPGLSKSDEVGDKGNDTNAAVISTGTGEDCCVSVGVTHGTCTSQETRVYGSHGSALRAESGVGEVGDIAEATENLGQTPEVVCDKDKPDRAPGDDDHDAQQTYFEQNHSSERDSDARTLWGIEATNEFDPVWQHRYFCPWVNANIVTSGCNSDPQGRVMCGWQLTLDALDTTAAAVESESASSMYNVNPLTSVRKIFGKTTQSKRSKRNSNQG